MENIGKFEVVGTLGKGSFGWVFHCLDSLLDVERAVKVIILKDSCSAEEFVESFNEAKILEMCKHAHIVEVKEVDVYEIRGNRLPCITTEYLKNGSAQDFLEKQFASVHDSCRIVSDVLIGLEHAHGQNILHRDIKPGNILFNDNWRAKLADFGLAFGLKGQIFDFAGYSSHLPPEVLANTHQDELSDIYSLGITFYRILNNLSSLKIPYVNKAQLLKEIKRERFPSRVYSSHIPEAIKKIVNKSINPNRSKRFQNCLSFRQAIQKIKFGIDWRFIDETLWQGEFNQTSFSIELLETKKRGFSIEFKRNSRKIIDFCRTDLFDEDLALNEFYKIIKDTSINYK